MAKRQSRGHRAHLRSHQQRIHRRQRLTYEGLPHVGFETGEAAWKRDLTAVKVLRRAVRLDLIPDEAPLAKMLANLLEAGPDGGGGEGTPASKAAFRALRIKWVKEVVRLLKESGNLPTAYVTLLPKHWRRDGRDLHFINPRKLKRSFRSLLDRRGITRLAGYIVGGIHGEFDSLKGEWRPHIHCWVVGKDMIAAIHKLRKHPNFVAGRHEAARVHIRRGPFDDLARQTSYTLQSWWPNRPTGDFAKNGTMKRGKRQRLPTMIHALWLLWMNDLQFQDFEILIGVRRGRDGLRPSRSACMSG